MVNNDKSNSPDCSGNPFLKTKIATESGEKAPEKLVDDEFPNQNSFINYLPKNV